MDEGHNRANNDTNIGEGKVPTSTSTSTTASTRTRNSALSELSFGLVPPSLPRSGVSMSNSSLDNMEHEYANSVAAGAPLSPSQGRLKIGDNVEDNADHAHCIANGRNMNTNMTMHPPPMSALPENNDPVVNNKSNASEKPPPTVSTSTRKSNKIGRGSCRSGTSRTKRGCTSRRDKACSSSQASLRAVAPSCASITLNRLTNTNEIPNAIDDDHSHQNREASSASTFFASGSNNDNVATVSLTSNDNTRQPPLQEPYLVHSQRSQQQQNCNAQTRSSSSPFNSSNQSEGNHSNNSTEIEPKGEWKEVEKSPTERTSTDNSHNSTLTPTGPSHRSLHAAAIYKNNFLVFGGFDGEARRNDFYCFSFDKKKWTKIEGLGTPPSPRDRHAAFVHGDCFYVFGGFDGMSRVNDFYSYNFNTNTWQQIIHNMIGGSSPPTPRHSHSVVVHDNFVYIFAGYDGSYRSDFHKYSFETNTWSVVPPSGRTPRARYRATCVVYKDYMVLFGGHDGTRHLSDVHFFDFQRRLWTPGVQVGGTPPFARDSHVSAVYGNAMYVFGGSAGSPMNDLYELSLVNLGERETGNGNSNDDSSETLIPTWRKVKCSGSISHRFCHVGLVLEDSFYVFGGYDGSSRLNDFVKFEFNQDDLIYDIPASSLVSDLRSFLNNETLCDVTFMVEGTPVRAHKIMLMRCSYFRAMFTGNMMEANQSVIHIEEVSHSIFLQVLEYLYTDEVKIPVEDAMELFVAADKFGIPRLQSMCEKQMLELIYVENAASIFHAADFHNANILREKAFKYILAHFEQVSKSAAFEEMARSNVELVVEILRMR